MRRVRVMNRSFELRSEGETDDLPLTQRLVASLALQDTVQLSNPLAFCPMAIDERWGER